MPSASGERSSTPSSASSRRRLAPRREFLPVPLNGGEPQARRGADLFELRAPRGSKRDPAGRSRAGRLRIATASISSTAWSVHLQLPSL
jgi:hypothetical protein